MDNEKINKLIESKVTTEDLDSGWMVALLLMRMNSTSNEIVSQFRRLELAIAEHDLAGTSLSEMLRRIAVSLEQILDVLRTRR